MDVSVQILLTEEGFDPVYGARPLRRAVMRFLEDTLAQLCLSRTLLPGTKIIVRRKTEEGKLITYTDELEVELDTTFVDPELLQNQSNAQNEVIVIPTIKPSTES